MSKILKPEDIKTGQWYSLCCHLDLYRIADATDLENVKESMRWWLKDHDPPRTDVWETKTEALLEMRKAHQSDEAIQEIDELLALGEIDTESYGVKEGDRIITHFRAAN